MGFHIPFFGMLSSRSPMVGLLEHYEQIVTGMDLIEEAMECYISAGTEGGCKDFATLLEEVNTTEDKADQIKRYIRNHAPRGMLMPVDRTLFFNYTRQQDNILDAGQDSLHWLAMRNFAIPEEFQRLLVFFLSEVSQTIKLLQPALSATIDLLKGVPLEREKVKETYRAVRAQHKVVNRKHNEMMPQLYNSGMDFKDIFLLIYFVKSLHSMSHNAEGCADMLRAMIAR